MQAMEFYSTLKKKEILTFATTCMHLENIMLSEINQSQEDGYCLISHTCMSMHACVLSRAVVTLWNPVSCSLLGSSVHGILQARMLEWVAISFPRGSSQPGIKSVSPALAVGFFPTGPSGKPHEVPRVVRFIETESTGLAPKLVRWSEFWKQLVVMISQQGTCA